MMLATMFGVPALRARHHRDRCSLFQTPGLARRDRQDRSIEFWLSLPTSHTASVAAPVLMHLVVVPLLALLIGAAFSYAIGLALIWKVFGAAQALALPWGELIAVGVELACCAACSACCWRCSG